MFILWTCVCVYTQVHTCNNIESTPQGFGIEKTIRKVTCLLHSVLEMFNFHFCLSLGSSSQKCEHVQINFYPVHTIILGSVNRKPQRAQAICHSGPKTHPVHIYSVRNSSGGLTFILLEVPRCVCFLPRQNYLLFLHLPGHLLTPVIYFFCSSCPHSLHAVAKSHP